MHCGLCEKYTAGICEWKIYQKLALQNWICLKYYTLVACQLNHVKVTNSSHIDSKQPYTRISVWCWVKTSLIAAIVLAAIQLAIVDAKLVRWFVVNAILQWPVENSTFSVEYNTIQPSSDRAWWVRISLLPLWELFITIKSLFKNTILSCLMRLKSK